MDEIIKAIIESLPVMISYIAYGAVFLTIYRFITFKDKKQEFTEYFFSCSAISFIIKIIDEVLLLWLNLSKYSNSWINYLCVLVVTALFAFIIARISISKWFNELLLNIGIERTTNANIWKDVLESNTKVIAHIKDKDLAYVGFHKYTEDSCANPKMVLSNYKLIELSTAKILTDYSNDTNRVIMIDTSEIDTIEFVYKNI